MELSLRLKEIAESVRPCRSLADVGTDHGYLPIYLVKTGRVQNAFALDIKKGPLSRAEKNIKSFGLEDKITVRLGAGLSPLSPGEAQTVVIAGMGGMLIRDILKDGMDIIKDVSQLVLSPQSFPESVRSFLIENGFFIDSEKIIKEDNHFYIILNAKKGEKEDYSPAELYFGKRLIEEKSPVFSEYTASEKNKLMRLLSALDPKDGENSKKRILEIKEMLKLINEVENGSN